MNNFNKDYYDKAVELINKSKLSKRLKAQTLLTIIAPLNPIEPETLIFAGEYLVRYLDGKRNKNVQNIDKFLRPTNPALSKDFDEAVKQNNAQIEYMIAKYGIKNCRLLGTLVRQIGTEFLTIQANQKHHNKKMN